MCQHCHLPPPTGCSFLPPSSSISSLQGANADVETVRGETPLHLAARANQTDVVRVLLRHGAKVDAKAREHQTPLHIASRLGNTDIVVLLIQAGK